MQSSTFVKPPKPILNGGLYTGEPFKEGAPWGNVPVISDVSYLVNVNLKSAQPPDAATTQFPGGIRFGNNYQKMPGVKYIKEYGILVNDVPKGQKCIVNNCSFSKYSYY